MSDEYLVTRCVCDDITFSEVKTLAMKCGYTNVSQLSENQICATNCKLCVPYIHRMLKTGETAFKEIQERISY